MKNWCEIGEEIISAISLASKLLISDASSRFFSEFINLMKSLAKFPFPGPIRESP